MKYTLIIPVYNVEKYLDRCLNSIINQSYKDLEIILINDGSTDNSLDICYKYATNDPRIKVFNQENQGVACARNIGLENATGDYLMFIDSDDYIERDAVEIINKCLTSNNYDLLIFNYKILNSSTGKIEEIKYNILDKYPLEYIIQKESLMVRGYLWNKIFKRECITKKFNKKHIYMEDLCFVEENLNNFKKFQIIYDSPYYIYNINENSVMNAPEYSEKRISALYSAIYIINITSEEYSCFQKLNLMKNYCRLRYNNPKFKDKYISDFVKKYLKDIFNNKNMSYKDKIKAYIWVKMPIIYNLKRKIMG